MSKFCTNCGYEINDETSLFCANCGTKIAEVECANSKNEYNDNTETTTETSFATKELIRIWCVGKNAFQERLLIIFNDHIEFHDTDNDIILFNESYDNIICARQNQSKIFSNIYFLDLKNGESFKFSLDINRDLKGSRYSSTLFNTDIKQISKTLVGYINKLIAAYKER